MTTLPTLMIAIEGRPSLCQCVMGAKTIMSSLVTLPITASSSMKPTSAPLTLSLTPKLSVSLGMFHLHIKGTIQQVHVVTPPHKHALVGISTAGLVLSVVITTAAGERSSPKTAKLRRSLSEGET